jgi:hypothetical protein
MNVVWPSPSLSVIKESEYISKFLKSNGFAEYLIEINQSTVTFEDHVEIMRHHFENKEAYDPYANAADKIKRQHDGEDNDLEDEYYQEGVHGRYDDFFVIPNEQYDHSKDDDRQSGGSFSPGRLAQKRPPPYLLNDMNTIVGNVDKELGLQWDKKKESHTRHRLMLYLMENRQT